MTFQNHLSSEKSPYLLQHQYNPVNWYPWGEEAIQKAKNENKLIFLSIGYSTCHWCHVMEKDSFENPEIARILNEHFVSIKVDREERPDLDQIYMDAVVAINGHGGWPMSIFLSPDLKPFFGGTFYWKNQFATLLEKIQQYWETDENQIRSSGEQLASVLQFQEQPSEAQAPDLETIKQAFGYFDQVFDNVYGGFGRAPKFPRSLDLSFLLRLHRRSQSERALQMVTITLDHMARGGIYDHLRGGFSRYSTDQKWLIPHFEKMLYDNALLSWTYLEAYQVTQKEMYAQVARETLAYLLQDMLSPQGGFYSAEDADSEGIEGKFYVWSYEEIESILTSDEWNLFSQVYSISTQGNFEHQSNVLVLNSSYDWLIKKDPLIQSAHQKLLSVRNKRVRPLKDDKILTEWNALMISSLCKAFQVLGDSHYLVLAQQTAHFIETHLYKDGILFRRYREGESRFSGMQTDYAFMIRALIDLYESDFNAYWLEWAQRLQKMQDALFWDEKSGGYYFASSSTTDLYMRTKEYDDGAIPSGNAVAAWNLLRMSALFYDENYLQKTRAIFKETYPFLKRYPPGYATTLMALDFALDRSKEIAVIACKENDPYLQEFLEQIYKRFLPNKVLAVAIDNDPNKWIPLLKNRPALNNELTFYICEDHTCQSPTTDIDMAIKAVEKFESFHLSG